MFVGEWAAGLPGVPDEREQLLIWCFRRLALDGRLQRSAAVEVTLTRGFGPPGQELSVLLRCLVHALAVHCPRKLVLGHACTPNLTADELRLLSALRGQGVAGLGPEVVLGPLVAAIQRLISER